MIFFCNMIFGALCQQYMKNETDWKTGLCFFTTVLDNQTQAPGIRKICENLIDFFFCPLNMDTFDFNCPNGTEAKCGDECKKLIGLLKNGDPDGFPPYGPLDFSGHMYLSFRALSQIGSCRSHVFVKGQRLRVAG